MFHVTIKCLVLEAFCKVWSLGPTWDPVSSWGQGPGDLLLPFLPYSISCSSLGFQVSPAPCHTFFLTSILCMFTWDSHDLWALLPWTLCFAYALFTCWNAHCHLGVLLLESSLVFIGLAATQLWLLSATGPLASSRHSLFIFLKCDTRPVGQHLSHFVACG